MEIDRLFGILGLRRKDGAHSFSQEEIKGALETFAPDSEVRTSSRYIGSFDVLGTDGEVRYSVGTGNGNLSYVQSVDGGNKIILKVKPLSEIKKMGDMVGVISGFVNTPPTESEIQDVSAEALQAARDEYIKRTEHKSEFGGIDGFRRGTK